MVWNSRISIQVEYMSTTTSLTPSNHFTIGIRRRSGVIVKLLKISYGRDGSYYVSCPYHPFNGMAQICLATFNYSRDLLYGKGDMSDIGLSKETKNAIKLSHHPDGWLQFSGGGILSGRNKKGFGLQSWSLRRPAVGPAFNLVIHSIEDYQKGRKGQIILFADEEKLNGNLDSDGLVISGYYHPLANNAYVLETPSGLPCLLFRRPKDNAIITSIALKPPPLFDSPGFLTIGFETQVTPKGAPQKQLTGFFLSTSTSNLRQNEDGDWLAEGMFLRYPKNNAWTGRCIDYI